MNENRIPKFTGDTNPFMPCSDNHDNYKANYMHVIPDSHFWTDLNQLLVLIENHFQLMESEPIENIYAGEPYMTKKYILTGLNNSKKNGYNLKVVGKGAMGKVLHVFANVDDMIEFVENRPFELKFDYMDFEKIIKDTLDCGLNLTNGLKIERREIYNRIDGERDYQDANWGSRRQMDGTPDEEKPVAEWVNYIEYHVSKAKEKIYHLDTKGATAELRKVAALAVRAMEIHGCPARQIEAGDGTKPTKFDNGCACSDCDCKKLLWKKLI